MSIQSTPGVVRAADLNLGPALFSLVLSLLMMSGCALVDPTTTSMPKGIPDGVSTYTFTRKEPLTSKSPDTVVIYAGAWRQGKPEGQGSVSTNYGLSCRGQFGVLPYDDASYYQNDIWAQGEVFVNGKLIYQGGFINYFKNAAACEPKGFGTRMVSGGAFSGEFFSEKFMKRGNCKIKRADGSTYMGTCGGPIDLDEPNMNAFINVTKTTDPFLLVAGPGAFVDSKGRQLTPEESSRKVGCLMSRSQQTTNAFRNYEIAVGACKRNAYSGNSNCLGSDGDMVRANRLTDALYFAEKELNYTKLAPNAKCDILDPGYLRNQTLEEQRHKEAVANEREQLAQERQAQQASNPQEVSSTNSSHERTMQALGAVNQSLKQELNRNGALRPTGMGNSDARNLQAQQPPRAQAGSFGTSSTLPPLPSTERAHTVTCLYMISEHTSNGKIDEEAVARNAWARGVNASSNCVERETRSGPSSGVSK